MSVDTVARFVITLAADPEKLKTYLESTENRIAMVEGLNPQFWPLNEIEKQTLMTGDFNLIYGYLDENGGIRGINEIMT